MKEPPKPNDDGAQSGGTPRAARSRPASSGPNESAETPVEPSSDSRARIFVTIAVLTFAALLLLLLFNPSKSSHLQSARRVLFGQPVANALSRGGGGNGGDIPDEQATGEKNPPDQPIGRLPSVLGKRKPGEEIRPGAAGTDDPAGRVGNSPKGEITDSPSAGGDPGNSSRSNSVDFPEGRSQRIGSGAGDGHVGMDSDLPAPTSATNRPGALLLDDFSERLKQAGARSGDVQVSLEWKNMNDLDLHVIDPAGEEIFYNHRISASGGHLDVDMNVQPVSERPVENVYWPDRGAPRGAYRVEVVHYRNHGAPDPTRFTVRVVVKGQQTYYNGSITYIPSARRARVAVCTFTVQ